MSFVTKSMTLTPLLQSTIWNSPEGGKSSGSEITQFICKLTVNWRRMHSVGVTMGKLSHWRYLYIANSFTMLRLENSTTTLWHSIYCGPLTECGVPVVQHPSEHDESLISVREVTLLLQLPGRAWCDWFVELHDCESVSIDQLKTTSDHATRLDVPLRSTYVTLSHGWLGEIRFTWSTRFSEGKD